MTTVPEIFFLSDTHFSHTNILSFVRDDGTPVRPEFSTVEEMDEYMIEQWNSYIRPEDRVYHLGDVAMNTPTISRVMPRLNGNKRLCLGNHDPDVLALRTYFKKIVLWRIFKDEGFVCSHIPLMPGQFRHKVVLNVHGHIHQNLIDDPRYFNVCVEHHDYRPVHMDEVLQKVREAREWIKDNE